MISLLLDCNEHSLKNSMRFCVNCYSGYSLSGYPFSPPGPYIKPYASPAIHDMKTYDVIKCLNKLDQSLHNAGVDSLSVQSIHARESSPVPDLIPINSTEDDILL